MPNKTQVTRYPGFLTLGNGLEQKIRLELLADFNMFTSWWYAHSRDGAMQALSEIKFARSQDALLAASVVGNVIWGLSVFTTKFTALSGLLTFFGIALGSTAAVLSSAEAEQASKNRNKFRGRVQNSLAVAQTKLFQQRKKVLDDAYTQLISFKHLGKDTDRRKRSAGLWTLMFKVPFGGQHIQAKAKADFLALFQAYQIWHDEWFAQRYPTLKRAGGPSVGETTSDNFETWLKQQWMFKQLAEKFRTSLVGVAPASQRNK